MVLAYSQQPRYTVRAHPQNTFYRGTLRGSCLPAPLFGLSSADLAFLEARLGPAHVGPKTVKCLRPPAWNLGLEVAWPKLVCGRGREGANAVLSASIFRPSYGDSDGLCSPQQPDVIAFTLLFGFGMSDRRARRVPVCSWSGPDSVYLRACLIQRFGPVAATLRLTPQRPGRFGGR